MESSMLKEKIDKEKQEFMCRLFSSCWFVLVAFLLFWVPYRVFAILCWVTYAFMVYEIFSSKIRGKITLRILAALFCFCGIRSFIYCRESIGQFGCVFLICISSLTDIGGYSVGKILKGPKLCPKISPNKTWAGFGGGILLANLAFLCLSNEFWRFAAEKSSIHMYMSNFWVVQIVILASVAGDLLESWFKRKIKVKDMGDLFPGHGGFLDRLDSLLLASIVFAILDILL
ncbi:MAG: phosphatidate cytidylyltransferase [Holosporaceae bacterium]|jgi:phosphatidate cytidylyltransferase|nr:phosphatidate cytidylyltransferase [Holosporaceae bacterium]